MSRQDSDDDDEEDFEGVFDRTARGGPHSQQARVPDDQDVAWECNQLRKERENILRMLGKCDDQWRNTSLIAEKNQQLQEVIDQHLLAVQDLQAQIRLMEREREADLKALNDQLDATKGRVFEVEGKIRHLQRRANRGCGCLIL
eukprot:GGOE01060551.1.p1 GENE.GGOE01060551.1~~GGOE01060551.1.p1  ORF type:complete len:156 (-),score=35.34 GGOE01060551.1:45-476(-)